MVIHPFQIRAVFILFEFNGKSPKCFLINPTFPESNLFGTAYHNSATFLDCLNKRRRFIQAVERARIKPYGTPWKLSKA